MALQTGNPGIYVEEVPKNPRIISGISTSITAFIGRAKKGPVDEPVTIFNFAEYESKFGGLWNSSTMSFAVWDYFQNGGGEAIIVRISNGGKIASANVPNQIRIEASSLGEWGNKISFWIDHETEPELNEEGSRIVDGNRKLFNLFLINEDGQKESFLNLSTDEDSVNYAPKLIEEHSCSVKISRFEGRPAAIAEDDKIRLNDGTDGSPIGALQIFGSQSEQKGLYALEKVNLFNLLCIPPYTNNSDIELSTYQIAVNYCKKRRAILIMDAPSSWTSITKALEGLQNFDRSSNAALYFPRLLKPNILKGNTIEEFVPCGSIAGIIAKTDSERGVWKAPAGKDARIYGVAELSISPTHDENGKLNQKGVNCLRSFPEFGNVVWGARTLEGSDELNSEWKYLPVKRMALHIEESLYRGLKWVVSESNGEPLWVRIRLEVGAFLHNLFRQGAFQGRKKDAYFIKCDSETNTQHDINRGVVNIVIGFSPLKPAEFIILKLQQVCRTGE